MSITKTILDSLKMPRFLGDSWLTEQYIKRYGWYPVPRGCASGYTETSFGKLPCKDNYEYLPGDVIVFYDGETLTITNKDLDDWKKGERDMLPCGVVVHKPIYQLARKFLSNN